MIKDGTCKKFFSFQLYEYAAIETFLSDMAIKGWMVESMVKRRGRGAVFTFHKIEPKIINFTVDICDKASTNETLRSEGTMEYIEYCQEAGWNLVCSCGKIQVFFSNNEKSIPIHTDDNLILKIINKGMLRWFLYSLFIIFLIFVFYKLSHFDVTDFLILTTNYTNFLYPILLLNIAIFPLINILDYGLWYINAKNKIKKGKSLNDKTIVNKRYFHLFSTTWIIFQISFFLIIYVYSLKTNFITSKLGLIALLIPFAFIIIFVLSSYFINNKNLKTNSYLFRRGYSSLYRYSLIYIYILVILIPISVTNYANSDYPDSLNKITLPITLADISTENLNITEKITSYEMFNGTFIAKHYSYSSYDSSSESSIAYSVFTSPYKLIINKYLELALNFQNSFSYSKMDPTSWDANSVYICKLSHGERIIVSYDNIILEFTSDSSLNKENIELIRNKLDLNN